MGIKKLDSYSKRLKNLLLINDLKLIINVIDEEKMKIKKYQNKFILNWVWWRI